MISHVIAEAPDRSDLEGIRKACSKAYPFGERRHWPYRIWLEEVAIAIGQLAALMSPDPMSRPCGACGAEPGKRCREYINPRAAGEDARWPIGVRRPTISEFHEARINPPAGPLFGPVDQSIKPR